MTYTPDKIRNIAIVGHQGSGKTSLVESLAYKSQLIKIKGTIENKNITAITQNHQRLYIGLLFFAPHAGQTLALAAMSAPHVLHFIILFPISAPLYFNCPYTGYDDYSPYMGNCQY